jgi:hypothetical protein
MCIKKRGEVEIQFNWILVLIAGALIFLFFFSVIRWVTSNFATTNTAKLSSYLDSILTASSIPKNTVNKVDFPFKQIDFDCEGYRIDSSQSKKQFMNKVVFAPSKITKGELIHWSFGWDVPFRVANFLFVSSSQARYIFLGPDDELFNFLNKTIPSEFNVEFNPTSIQDLNNFKVRIIYVNTNVVDSHAGIFKRLGANDLTALAINGDSIAFYRKSASAPAAFESIRQLPSIKGEAALLGAIFSEDPEYFICMMEKAVARYKNTAKIYATRSAEIAANYPGADSFCAGIHLAANVTLTNTVNSGEPDITTLSGLEDQAYSNSCILIY